MQQAKLERFMESPPYLCLVKATFVHGFDVVRVCRLRPLSSLVVAGIRLYEIEFLLWIVFRFECGRTVNLRCLIEHAMGVIACC